MPSAFISYAHTDREFVLALIERLQAQGLDIRYDQIVLQVGDSLIQKISQEITDGDFLVAVVSPDSVQSGWCQTELALAMNQGINQRKIKVLPVRFRGAAMPNMLDDTFWVDADRDDIETVARRLAAAVRAHEEGRDADVIRDAEQAEDAGHQPPHAERAGDVAVAQLDDVAQKVFDLFEDWTAVFAGQANVLDIENRQRRLRWAVDVLPDHIRAGLPLVRNLATARDIYFAGGENEPDEVERDINDELLTVRLQVAQGLPVTRRWTIDEDLGPIGAGRRDATARLWQITRDEESFRIVVYVSGTVMEAYEEALPPEVAEAKRTNGRSAISTLLSLEHPPVEVMVSTTGIGWPLPG